MGGSSSCTACWGYMQPCSLHARRAYIPGTAHQAHHTMSHAHARGGRYHSFATFHPCPHATMPCHPGHAQMGAAAANAASRAPRPGGDEAAPTLSAEELLVESQMVAMGLIEPRDAQQGGWVVDGGQCGWAWGGGGGVQVAQGRSSGPWTRPKMRDGAQQGGWAGGWG